jgi:hypothetical protein
MTESPNKILDKIKKEKIAPKPKWQFRLEQVGLWFLAMISVLIGSNAVAAIIFRMVNNDWDALKFIERSPIGHTLTTLPYVWIVVLGLFILLAYYNTRHTKKGYKYNTYGVVLGAILASVIVGTFLYIVGFGPRVEMFMQRVPGMEKMMHNREQMWTYPEKGFVAGEITGMLSGVGSFEIIDLENEEWIIVPVEVYIDPRAVIEVGESVRIFGEIDEPPIFEAYKIMPWEMRPPIKDIFEGKMNRQYYRGEIKAGERAY